jgi:hypothetical protein
MNLIVSTITVAGLFAALILSLSSAKNPRIIPWIRLCVGIACLGAILQGGKAYVDARDDTKNIGDMKRIQAALLAKQDQERALHDRERLAARERYAALADNHDQLIARHEETLARNRDLQSKIDDLAPFLSLVVEKQGAADRDAIQHVVSEVHAIFHPEIMLLRNRTEQTKEEKTGLYKTTYFFEPRHPATVREVGLFLELDTDIIGAEASLEYILPLQSHDTVKTDVMGSRHVICVVKILPETATLRVTLTSAIKPIVARVISMPPEQNRDDFLKAINALMINERS